MTNYCLATDVDAGGGGYSAGKDGMELTLSSPLLLLHL